MRKRNVSHIADTIFWYVVYMLPIILTVIQSIGVFGAFTFDNWHYIFENSSVTDYDFMHLLEANLTSMGFNGGLIYSTLDSIFGSMGILPIVNAPAIFLFAEWFVTIMLIHLFVDFILFIPRLSHKWMKKATEED